MDGGIYFFNGFGDDFLRPSTLHNINNETLARSKKTLLTMHCIIVLIILQKPLTNLNDKLGNNFTKLMTKKAV